MAWCAVDAKADCSEANDVDRRRKRSLYDHNDDVLHRNRRAADTNGGTYTVTNRFEVSDDSDSSKDNGITHRSSCLK